MLAATYSPGLTASTIGAGGLNCPVRHGKGCSPPQRPPACVRAPVRRHGGGYVFLTVVREGRARRAHAHRERPRGMLLPHGLPYRTIHRKKTEAVGQLVPLGSNALLRFHLRPIDVVFSHGPPPPKRMERSSRGRLRT